MAKLRFGGAKGCTFGQRRSAGRTTYETPPPSRKKANAKRFDRPEREKGDPADVRAILEGKASRVAFGLAAGRGFCFNPSDVRTVICKPDGIKYSAH